MMIIGGLILFFLVAGWAVITQPLWSNPPPDGSTPAISSSRLQDHVHYLSVVCAPRDHEHLDNLNRAAAYLRQQFDNAQGITSEQAYEVNGRRYQNVIALFGPDTQERIVVGAHYDAAFEYPAADDNASGVAGLIELAGLLQNAPLPMRVELVAYTLEEPPYFRSKFMGSAVHANALKEQAAAVRLMFSIEMIGYYSDAPNSQKFPTALLSPFYPSRGNFLAIVGKFGQGSWVRRVKRAMRGASSLPVYSINAPEFVPGIDFSDHLNYWQAGYEALMITDTSFYRNHHYHTAKDTPETLDYQRMAMAVQAIYAAVLAVSQ
ncbi:MAG: M28 family peptidase [Acidobacteria bacterium]|nr:M28 family peptidase [Acidobacteriota bacterium]